MKWQIVLHGGDDSTRIVMDLLEEERQLLEELARLSERVSQSMRQPTLEVCPYKENG